MSSQPQREQNFQRLKASRYQLPLDGLDGLQIAGRAFDFVRNAGFPLAARQLKWRLFEDPASKDKNISRVQILEIVLEYIEVT